MREQESAANDNPSDRPGSWNRGKIAGLAMVLLISLLGLRTASEIGMMREYGPDPQMGIWVVITVMKLGLWLLGGALAVGLLVFSWPKRVWSAVGLVSLLIWAVAIGRASWQYNEGRRALADAADPTTSPERLQALVHFDGIQAGYELDNRLAKNRDTPPEALRELSQRVEQAGTQMLLAKNPRTPQDVRARLRQP